MDSDPRVRPNVAIEGMSRVLSDIIAERRAQDLEWGGPSHDDGHGELYWAGLIEHHLERLARDMVPSQTNRDAIRTRARAVRRRLVVLGALATAAAESMDRRTEHREAEWADIDQLVSGDHLGGDHE